MSDNFRSEQEMLSKTVKEAVDTIKSSIGDFTQAAADTRDTATSAVKKLGSDTADQLNGLSTEAQYHASRGVDSVSKSISANPILALSIAAGAGFLFGMAARSGRR